MASTRSNKANENKISHYVLEELLVEQATSAIYLAQDSKSNETVLLVTLQPDAAKSSDLAERFQRRAETLAQLTHETFLPLTDFGMDGKRPYAVMPHRAGQFLSEKLEASPPHKEDDTDKSKIIASLQLVKQIASGLSLAHPSGLIHHDLCPDNIFLDEAGQPYLLDLVVPPTPPTISQVEQPQPVELDYQSPEQQAGKSLSGRSNIFSLGILLYHLLTGQKPALPVSEWDIFDHKGMTREIPLEKVRTDLTEATYRVVRDSIWQKEWSRYETVDSQIRAIDRAIKAESAPALPPLPAWRLLLNQLRQPKTLKILIPAIVVFFLLLLVFIFVRGRSNRQQNVTPTPEGASLPLEIETAELIEAEKETPAQPENTPFLTVETSNEATINEGEVLPPTGEVEPPTAVIMPTETAVLATPTNPLPTASPTPLTAATSTTQATDSPTQAATQASCVPSPPFGWVRYAIQANDSLSALSQSTNTTVERLLEVNCLNSILLSIGQEIWLPFNPNTTATPSLPNPTNPAATAVPPGDNPQPPTPTSERPTPTVGDPNNP
jgi:serine/threonine protein kinase